MNKEQKRKKGFKRKLSTFCIGMAALLILAVWTPNVTAYPDFGANPGDNCQACHDVFTGGSGSVGHAGHLGLGLPGSCNACHGTIGDNPNLANCVQCHVQAGLVAHHTNAGVMGFPPPGLSCDQCHPGLTPAPENTPVPGYATITASLDPCNGSEELFASNTISLDNDGDLLTDGDDPDCAPAVEICDDGIDNDGDGLVDCDDQDCAADPACPTTEPETECADGNDNDGDGLVDCADPDCDADPACQQPGEVCTGGEDEDGDGLVDCADPDCANDAACQPPSMEICDDGVDNDGDGMVDCDDQDCAAKPACKMQPPVMEVCDDGRDNDNDGFIDCKDPDCRKDPACKKQETCPQFNPPGDHTMREEDDGCEAFHAPGLEKPFTNSCTACHGSDLRGDFAPSCFTCHGREWDEKGPGGPGFNPPPDHTDKEDGFFHKPGKDRPFSKGCTACHGQDLTGGIAPSCFTCHGREWDEKGPGGQGDHDDHSSDDDDRRWRDSKVWSRWDSWSD